jgi:hypothetical protein
MSHQRPNEPIGPTNIPGEPLDPKIPPTQDPEPEDDNGLVDPDQRRGVTLP